MIHHVYYYYYYTTSVLLSLLLSLVIPVHIPHTSDVSLCLAVPVISRAGSCAWMLHVMWGFMQEPGSHVTLRDFVMSLNTGREQR